MSLTSFIEIDDVKHKFHQEFPKPRLSSKKELLAPPLTKRYSLIGTAFDYLLRFHIERLNPKSISTRWVAVKSLKKLDHPLLMYDVDKEKLVVDNTLHEKAKKILNQAKKNHSNYLETGKMNKGLIKSALLLAHLESICRGWVPDDDFFENLGTVAEKDVKDLQNLISLVDANVFKSRKICLLNPTFGKASRMVGGADADLIIDDMIIEIKTIKRHFLLREYFNQLLGYYVLHRIGNVEGLPNKHKINRLGIYYSRFGYLYTMDIKDIINKKTFPAFLRWFKVRANHKYKIRK